MPCLLYIQEWKQGLVLTAWRLIISDMHHYASFSSTPTVNYPSKDSRFSKKLKTKKIICTSETVIEKYIVKKLKHPCSHSNRSIYVYSTTTTLSLIEYLRFTSLHTFCKLFKFSLKKYSVILPTLHDL